MASIIEAILTGPTDAARAPTPIATALAHPAVGDTNAVAGGVAILVILAPAAGSVTAVGAALTTRAVGCAGHAMPSRRALLAPAADPARPAASLEATTPTVAASHA